MQKFCVPYHLIILFYIGTNAYAQNIKTKVQIQTVSNDSIYNEVDTQAQYIGGNIVFLSMVHDNFNHPQQNLYNEEILDYFDITFVVNPDSTVSDIEIKNAGKSEQWQACEREIVRVWMMSDKKWIPAKFKGASVRQRVRMPLQICYEDED